ncbi:reticulon-2 [Apteryx mantelli]|uniref:Reticulon n=1 Tax=Apteryx mantelli TaxID=2696672 RepID=A0ABM4FZX1_9AVES
MRGGAGPGAAGAEGDREPHAGAAAMGQVLGFAHCKESPSTASTTPDSTEGGNEESDFPELPPTPEPPEEEEEEADEDAGGRGGPRELTFSYIAFGGGGPPGEPTARARRDPRRGRPPRLSPGPGGGGERGVPPRGPDPRAPPLPAPPAGTPDPPEGPLGTGGAQPGPATREQPPSPAAAAAAAAAPPQPPPPPPPPLPARPAGGAAHPPPPAPPASPSAAAGPQPIAERPQEGADQSASPLRAEVIVWELLYWRAPGRSALALAAALGALLCLARFSAVTVGAYGALAVLAVTLPLRLHRAALRALRPAATAAEHPFRAQLDAAVGLSPEQQQRCAQLLGRHLAAAARTLAHLFLVRSLPESLKFAFLFYLLTYVGAVFNGLTLLGIGVICAFTFPVLYRHHQAQIDQYVGLVRNHLSHLRARIQAKLPSAKAKPQ